MKSSHIRVYITNEVCGWIIGKGGWRIKKIAEDTRTHIYHLKGFDSYFKIDGLQEDVHKARIILQDLEKEFYREEYVNDIEKQRKKINLILDNAEKSLQDLDNMSKNI